MFYNFIDTSKLTGFNLAGVPAIHVCGYVQSRLTK
jgi:hypothetical protein